MGTDVDAKTLRQLLADVAAGTASVDDAARKLARLPFEEMGFAKLDHHRHIRRGFPEVVFGEGKSIAQIVALVGRLLAADSPVMVTRIDPDRAQAVLTAYPELDYHEAARILYKGAVAENGRGTVAVVTAGTSDIPVAEEAALTARLLGNRVEKVFDVGVAGLHRLAAAADAFSRASVVIVVAGMEGALASVIGGLVDVPVIGVPTSVGYGASFGGVAALLAMLNSCAGGVSVVNIDNGFGAAMVATLINRERNFAVENRS
jgi:NCAIR mutase (PurE)-related protein